MGTNPNDDLMPIQGSTISSDLQIAGPKIFSDASWKCSKIPGRPIVPATGIGVYLQVPDDGIGVSIMIQASTAQANSPLMAEAAAMLLASLSAKALNLHGVTFLSDNLSLTKAAAARSLGTSLPPWSTRRSGISLLRSLVALLSYRPHSSIFPES